MKLPLNCTVDYYSNFLSEDEANDLYQLLINEYNLDTERIIIEAGGQMITTDSFKILMTTEELQHQNSHPEHIHGKSFVWKGLLADLKSKVEEFTGKTFELAMCLYYPDGTYFAPYHFDQETSGNATILPSISLGSIREFSFKETEKGDISYSLSLANGSLLLMGDYCQSRYVHSLPKDPNCSKGRINITFREPSFK